METSPQHRMVLPFEAWPDLDRSLWQAGLKTGDPFDGSDYASGLMPMTLRNARRGYGRWLAVLTEAGLLNTSEQPAARVIPAHVRVFHAALRAAGNSNNTIITRFFDLQAALKILQPDVDFSWLTSPGGVSLRKQLTVTLRPRPVIDSADLVAWGYALMDTAPERHKAPERCSQYRDGLLIVLMAFLPLRLRSMAALRIGQHLIPEEGGYRLSLKAEDVKNKKSNINGSLPAELVPYMKHYLEEIRPELLDGRQQTWLWVHAGGRGLSEAGISVMIRRRSLNYFGREFGPHTFRHSFATTAARALPDNPGLAATVLAVTPGVVEDHYNFARQEQAAETYVEHVREERRWTRRCAGGKR